MQRLQRRPRVLVSPRAVSTSARVRSTSAGLGRWVAGALLLGASSANAAGPVATEDTRALGPAPATGDALTTGLGATASADEYAATVAEIERLDQAINAGEDVRGPLFDALARLSGYAPSLAADPRARSIRTRAQLNLARLYLAEGATLSAAGILDEVLRASMGERVPVAEFGPSLVALHDRRRSALEQAGTARIGIRCPSGVRGFVDERAVVGETGELYLGVYRVTLLVERPDDGEEGSEAGGEALERHWVRLRQPGELVTVACRVSTPATAPDHPATAAQAERLLSPALELALIVFGSGVATSGGLLLGLGGARDRGRVIAGSTLVGLGGATLLFGSITFAVDEVRVGQTRGRQALVQWRVRF